MYDITKMAQIILELFGDPQFHKKVNIPNSKDRNTKKRILWSI